MSASHDPVQQREGPLPHGANGLPRPAPPPLLRHVPPRSPRSPVAELPRRVRLRDSVLDRLPPVLRGGALDPAVRGALGLAVLALIAALVAGCYAWQARPRAVALPQVTGSAEPKAQPQLTAHPVADPVRSEGNNSPAAGANPRTEVVVHVAGKVRRPGVVTLAASARVNDAVVAAGGALSGTDLSSVDLARHVVDGEQILVGVAGTPAAMSAAPLAAAPGTGGGVQGQPATASGPGEVLNLNTAGQEQLDSLPGVGPVLAQRIIAWRTEHGGFHSVEELREVKGLGGKKFDDIAPMVRV